MKTIICFDGCHGVGKTTLLNKLFDSNQFLDEGFLSEYEMKKSEMTQFQSSYLDEEELRQSDDFDDCDDCDECKDKENIADPQSFENEQLWVCKWFRRINEQTDQVIICDRSPLAACAYVKTDKELLEQQIIQKIKSLDIQFHILILDIDLETTMKQIQKRLKKEPFRKKYNEDDIQYTSKVWKFFHKMKRLNFISKNLHIHSFKNQNELVEFYKLLI